MSQPTICEANINWWVQVRLTHEGRKHYYEYMRSLLEPYGKMNLYSPPEENSEGWSRWQMHELIGVFGSRVTNGTLPFETTIRIELER